MELQRSEIGGFGTAMGCLRHAWHRTIAHFLNLSWNRIDAPKTRHLPTGDRQILMRKLICQIFRGWSKAGGMYLRIDDCINLWIGPWYASLNIDSAAREAQSLNLFSVLSQILGSFLVKTMNTFRFESDCQISELLTNYFFWCRRSVCSFRMTLKVREIHFFDGKCGIPSFNIEINCVLCGWHWGPDYFHRFDGNGLLHLLILCAIYGEHRRSAYFHAPGSTSGNSPIYCQERTLSHA
jgi:hypothetical protein